MIAIRRAIESDLDEIATFWRLMFQEAQMYDAPAWPPNWRQRYHSYFSRLMGQDEAAFFLALNGDRIVGTAGGIVRDGYPTAILNRRVGYIFNVRVDPEYRKRGLARELTKCCVNFLFGIGCTKVRLHAAPAARNIYISMGFVPTTEMELHVEAQPSSLGN